MGRAAGAKKDETNSIKFNVHFYFKHNLTHSEGFLAANSGV